MPLGGYLRCFLSVGLVFMCFLPFQLNAESISLPVGTGANIVIDVPSRCATSPLTPQYYKACNFVAEDGGTRNISLLVDTFTLSQFLESFGASKGDFSTNPNGYLRGMLLAMEEQATSVEPAAGQKMLTAKSRLQAYADNPDGWDECLVFDFDYSAKIDMGEHRFDGTGVRCLGYDEASEQVIYVYIKYGNSHDYLDQRAKDFELEAGAIIDSLRFE